MTGKPFSKLNYDSNEDIIALLYVCGPMNTTFEDFKNHLDKKSIPEQIKQYEIQTTISAQFQKKIAKKGKKGNKKDSNKEDKPVFIKDIVSVLILEGLDANFALYRMDISDLHIFIDALEDIKKERLESQRLWTYLTITPHLTKKIKSPKDLYPFPWEMEQIKEDAARNIEENKELLDKFLKGELIDINKIHWK